MLPDLITTKRLAEIKARVEAQEIKAKHWDGEEHHLGCGYGSSGCPGHPRWDFSRADFPDLISALERAVELLRSEHNRWTEDEFKPGCEVCQFLKEFDRGE